MKEELKAMDGAGGGGDYKRAMLDLKAKHRESSNLDGNWAQPKLTSSHGVHQDRRQHNRPQWWETTFQGNKNFEVGKLTYMKRADGPTSQFPTAVRIQYYDEAKRRWNWYKKAAWIPTGVKRNDPTKKVHNIVMKPTFEARIIRIHLDRAHNNEGWFSGRYDWWIRPV